MGFHEPTRKPGAIAPAARGPCIDPKYTESTWSQLPFPNTPESRHRAPKGTDFAPQRGFTNICTRSPPLPSPGGTRTTRGACSEPHGAPSVRAQTESQLFSSRNSAQIKRRTNTWTASQQHSCSSFPSCTSPRLKLGGSLISVVGSYQMERRGVPRTDPWLTGELGAALPTAR